MESNVGNLQELITRQQLYGTVLTKEGKSGMTQTAMGTICNAKTCSNCMDGNPEQITNTGLFEKMGVSDG